MKKTLLKTAVAALALFMGASAYAAEPTVLYERTAEDWTDADLTEWVNDNAQYVTQTIDGGLKMTAKNSGWTSTKSIEFSANSIVTITATLTGGNANGRAGSYDFVNLGGAMLQVDGQNQKASIVIGDQTTELSGKSTRGGTFNVVIVVNQASNEATVTVSGDKSGTATGTVNLTETLTGVSVGHYKAGKENYDISEVLNAIKVEEEVQAVQTAEYTINYLLGEEIVKTETGSSVVGNTVDATAPFTVDGQKYYFADDATTSLTVSASAEDNVLNVAVRKAYEYAYTVNSSNPETLIAEGSGFEGNSVDVYYPRYLMLESGSLTTKNANSSEYKQSFTLTSNNQIETWAYSNANINDVVYLVEAEKIEGMIPSSNNSNRTSCGLGAYATDSVDIFTLEPGKYKLTVSTRTQQATDFVFAVGGKDVLTVSSPRGNTGGGTSEEFVVKSTSTLYMKAAGSANNLVDYLYIQKTGDYTPVEVSYSLEYKAKLYLGQNNFATEESVIKTVTATGIEGEAVVITPEEKENIVIFTGENNDIKRTYSYVSDDAEGKTIEEGLVVTLNYAYNAEAGIDNVAVDAAEEAGKWYNLQGIEVAQPTQPGLYIHNGKKVVVK